MGCFQLPLPLRGRGQGVRASVSLISSPARRTRVLRPRKGMTPSEARYLKTQRARSLRKRSSIPERMLWRALRDRRTGLKFRRQHPIGPYTADFYCHEARLVVEVDGYWTHVGRRNEDRVREAWMMGRGILTLRVSASSVTEHASGVAEFIAGRAERRMQEMSKKSKAQSPHRPHPEAGFGHLSRCRGRGGFAKGPSPEIGAADDGSPSPPPACRPSPLPSCRVS